MFYVRVEYINKINDRRCTVVFWSIIMYISRCSPEELGFSAFAAGAASANPTTPFSSMPYLKSSPYLMAVDPLHSMGYSTASEFFFVFYWIFIVIFNFCSNCEWILKKCINCIYLFKRVFSLKIFYPVRGESLFQIWCEIKISINFVWYHFQFCH